MIHDRGVKIIIQDCKIGEDCSTFVLQIINTIQCYEREYIEVVLMARLGMKVTSYLLMVALILIVLPLPHMKRSLSRAEEITHTQSTIIVNASGGGDYTHIQWAIDNTSEGDTIQICAGTYFENIKINKTLTLIGSGSENTTVNGGNFGTVIEVTANWVNISGMKICNSAIIQNEIFSGINLINSNNSKIENNEVSNNDIGIRVHSFSCFNYIANNTCILNRGTGNSNGICIYFHSNNNSVINNTCKFNEESGILVEGENQIVIKNRCYNNSIGINIEYSKDSILLNNSCYDNEFGGIILGDSENITLEKNTMIRDGILIYSRSFIDWNTHTIPITNTVNNKPVYYWKNVNGGTIPPGAGQVILAKCSNIVVRNQNLSNATVGISIGFSSDNIISNNTCMNNDRYGIFLIGSSLNNVIIDNICNLNVVGMYLYYGCTHNLIMNNSCDMNKESGILIEYPGFQRIENNSFNMNGEDGISLHGGVHSVIKNNQCNSNGENGIYSTSKHSVFSHNQISQNNHGLHLQHGQNNLISNNICFLNNYGIFLYLCKMNIIENNTCSFSIEDGMYLYGSGNNLLCNNTADSNAKYGIYLVYRSYENTLYHNKLLNQGAGFQACDGGSNNIWNTSTFGNYWSDWTIPDNDGNGIVDIPYEIPGAEKDFYPLVSPIVEKPPHANAGSDISINQHEIIQLNGTLSSAFHPINNYTWFFSYDSMEQHLYGSLSFFTFHIPGIYLIILEITDSRGNYANDTMIVIVRDITSPSANAGNDIIIQQHETIIFNASHSDDNIGIINYTWSFIYEQRQIYLYGIGPDFIFDEVGVYIVILNVTDGEEHWAIDTLNVIVIDITPPTVEAGPDIATYQHQVVFFNASDSHDNVGIADFTWSFTYDTGVITLNGKNTFFTFHNADSYIITLNITDAEGNWATDILNVTVSDITPPIAHAGPDIIINQLETVEFFFHQESSDNVGCWNWTWTFQYNGTTQMLFHSISMSSLPFFTFEILGNYSVTMTVYDEASNWAVDTINVTVLNLSLPNEIDSDNDTYNDTYELSLGSDPYNPLSTPFDLDADGWNNSIEEVVGTDPQDNLSVPPDIDEDGIPDSIDSDRDGDGVANVSDAFPNDPDRWESEGKDEESETSIYAWVGIVILVSIFVVAGVILYLYQRRNEDEAEQSSEDDLGRVEKSDESDSE